MEEELEDTCQVSTKLMIQSIHWLHLNGFVDLVISNHTTQKEILELRMMDFEDEVIQNSYKMSYYDYEDVEMFNFKGCIESL